MLSPVLVSSARLAAFVAGFGSAGFASTARAESIGELRQPIIYGEDDRRQVYEVEDERLRALARESVAAFVSPRALSYDATGQVSIHAPTLGQSAGLCSGEAFADEPSLAFCSSVLIDDDLVATAGHCLGASRSEAFVNCRSLAVVFNYLYDAAGQLAPLTAEDVYRCRRVVAWTPGNNVDPDFAVVQLDRSVRPGLSSAPFAPSEVEVGQHIHVIGFGAGLPAKIDSGAVATLNSPFSEYFTGATDTFGGNSGSPIFDDAGQLLGLHVAGQPDWTSMGFCTAAARTDQGDELHQRASSVLAEVCGSGWPSPRLCGTPAACGDGVCSSGEPCSADCPVARCGDRFCEGDEPLHCDSDCPSFAAVPPSWTCPAEYYGDQLGCDCNCGARDIDCDNPFQEVLNCGAGAFCDVDGACARPSSSSPDEDDAFNWYSSDGLAPDGTPPSSDEEDELDDLIIDERDLAAPPAMQRAGSDGGCAISSRLAAAQTLAPWLLLALYVRRRRPRSR